MFSKRLNRMLKICIQIVPVWVLVMFFVFVEVVALLFYYWLNNMQSNLKIEI